MRFWILLCFVINAISASKIAIFTFEHSNSQAIFNNKLAIALADGGHEVLLVRPVVNSKLTVESLIHAQIKTFTPNNGYDYEIYRPFEDVKIKHMFRNSSIFEGFEMSSTFFDLSMHICNNTLSDQALIKHLKEEKIDLAFHHHMDFCQMALIQHLNISKWIYFSSLPPYPALLNSAGQFVPTSVLPSYVLQTGNEMSFLQRSLNHFVEFLNGHLRLSKQADGQTELARRLLGNHITNLIDFPKTANLVMLSGDPIIEFPIPTTRKVVYIGGLGTRKETKELPKEFENFITDAEKVVVISFGSWTVAKHMPKFWKDALIQLFKNHPKIRFVWSCEENLVLPPNAFRASWIPQDSLLANNKSILLITHAGYNSLMEAVQHGIPTIAIPLFSFGDQARNAHLFKKHGTTVHIPKEEFSFERLEQAFVEITTEKSFKERALGLQHIILSKPNKAEAELLYWVDVITNTDIFLDLPDLNTFEIYSLDVILASFLFFLALFLFIRFILSWYYWSCFEMAFKEKVKLQ